MARKAKNIKVVTEEPEKGGILNGVKQMVEKTIGKKAEKKTSHLVNSIRERVLHGRATKNIVHTIYMHPDMRSQFLKDLEGSEFEHERLVRDNYKSGVVEQFMGADVKVVSILRMLTHDRTNNLEGRFRLPNDFLYIHITGGEENLVRWLE